MIALGLTAADERRRSSASSPRSCSPQGVELEGHADNLAAALAGGVCLTWDDEDRPPGRRRAGGPDRARPRGDGVRPPPPALRCPSPWRTATRRSPPDELHCSAPRSRPARPSCSPRRSPTAFTSPTARTARRCSRRCAKRRLPALSAPRISGSGPTVIVWARPEAAAACARELADRFPGVSVLSLSVSPEGAHSL